MSSQLLTTIHIVSATVFLLIYLVKTILIFSNVNSLQKFAAATKVFEMIVSTLFLVTGVWLFVILGAIKTFQIIKLVCVFASIPIAIIGFKKLKKGLALFSFILILLAYGLSDMSKSKPYIPKKAETADLGANTYTANCAMCHGQDGKKQYRNASDLSTSMYDMASTTVLIKEGRKKGEKGTMPAFGKTLSDEEVNAVAAYVVTLRK